MITTASFLPLRRSCFPQMSARLMRTPLAAALPTYGVHPRPVSACLAHNTLHHFVCQLRGFFPLQYTCVFFLWTHMDFWVSIRRDLRSFGGYETPPASGAFSSPDSSRHHKKAAKSSHRHHIQCGQCLVSSQVIIAAETERKFSRQGGGVWGVDSGRRHCYTSDKPKAQSFSHKSVVGTR